MLFVKETFTPIVVLDQKQTNKRKKKQCRQNKKKSNHDDKRKINKSMPFCGYGNIVYTTNDRFHFFPP